MLQGDTEKRTHTEMHRTRFEPANPVFVRSSTVHTIEFNSENLREIFFSPIIQFPMSIIVVFFPKYWLLF